MYSRGTLGRRDRLATSSLSNGGHNGGHNGGRSLDILVVIFISFGIKAPHCWISHTLCSPANPKAIIIISMARVKRGRRNRYERARPAFNDWIVGIAHYIRSVVGRRGVGIPNGIRAMRKYIALGKRRGVSNTGVYSRL
jgi:hypothetical protein